MTNIPGNTSTTSRISTTGQTRSSLDFQGDSDWFRIDLKAGLTYDFRLSGDGGPSTLDDGRMYIRDALGNVIGSPTYTDGLLRITPSVGGTFYLSIEDYSSDGLAEGSYVIQSSFSDTIVNNATTDRSITGTGTTSSSLGQESDSDWFRLELSQGLSYGFALSGDGSVNTLDDARIELLDENGSRIAYDYNGGLIRFNPTGSGEYFIAVLDYSSDGRAEGNYRITAMMNDRIVNNSATTSVLAANGKITSKVDAPNDTDWHKVTLKAGITYGFDISGTAASGLSDPDLYLRDGTGATILANGANYYNAASAISWTAQQAGTYFVQAGNINETDTGGYVLRSTATDTVRNDTLTTQSLRDGERRTGTIDVATDQDWFKLQLTEGRSYTFTLSGDGSADALTGKHVALYDADGVRQTYSSTSTGSASATITFTASEGGSYFIGAAGYYTSETGGFALRIGSDARVFTGTSAANDILGNAQNNVIRGAGGNDLLAGSGGNDTLYGDAGRDRLEGGAAADRLFGGSGADTLGGGTGNDRLTGGSGADVFVFGRNGDADTIVDFASVDTIRLSGLGVSTVRAALAEATESRGNVIFDFGRGDVLTVLNSTKAALADDLIFG